MKQLDIIITYKLDQISQLIQKMNSSGLIKYCLCF